MNKMARLFWFTIFGYLYARDVQGENGTNRNKNTRPKKKEIKKKHFFLPRHQEKEEK